jgi:hypothetical protein
VTDDGEITAARTMMVDCDSFDATQAPLHAPPAYTIYTSTTTDAEGQCGQEAAMPVADCPEAIDKDTYSKAHGR